MDKTPAWLNYMTLQAVNLDGDAMTKLNLILSGIFGSTGAAHGSPVKQPKGRLEEMSALRNLGFNVKREK